MSAPAFQPRTLFASGLFAAGVALGALAAAESPPPQLPSTAPPATAPAPAPLAVPPAPPPAAPPQAGKPSVSTRVPARPAPVRNAPAPRPESQPTWAELKPQQQQALAPLATTWRVLTEAHKRKWLALSQNYPTMPPGERARLHSRMAEWAALSPQQRTLARLNFAESQQLNADDKRAKWEAYQNLSPEEKRKLAAGAVAAKPPPPPTAVAVQPVPQQKLVRIPRPKKADKPAVAPASAQGPALSSPAPASLAPATPVPASPQPPASVRP